MTELTKTTASGPSSSPRRRFALWQGAAALSTLALVPLATGAMATVDSKTQEEISRFMDVYLEVKSNYVEQVDDSKLIRAQSTACRHLDRIRVYDDAASRTAYAN